MEKVKTHAISTVIFAIVAVGLAIISTVILPVSVSEAMKNLSENSSSPAGAAVAAPFVAIILVFFIFLAIAAGIVVLPMFIISLIFNVHSPVLWVRIVAIATDAIFAYEIVVAVFKTIQLIAGY